MEIRPYTPSFKAKFVRSESLTQVVEYAVEKGKFAKINQARKNIDTACLKTRLRVDIGVNDKGFPFVTFARLVAKPNVVVPQYTSDYKIEKIVEYVSEKKIDPCKFAFEKIVKMGNNAPKNKMYQNVVVKK